jgi:hypothetical protein
VPSVQHTRNAKWSETALEVFRNSAGRTQELGWAYARSLSLGCAKAEALGAKTAPGSCAMRSCRAWSSKLPMVLVYLPGSWFPGVKGGGA